MYHLTLGGQGFLVDLASYTVRGAEPLAAAASVATLGAADAAAVDPFFERSQRQIRFSAGMRVQRFADPAQPDGWSSGVGLVPTDDGALRLGPDLVDGGAGSTFGQGVRAFAVFRGALYAGLNGTPGEVWARNGAAWSLAFTTGRPGVRAMAVYRDRLYLGCAGDGAVLRWDGTALSTAWTNAGVTAVDAMCVWWVSGASRLLVANSVDGGQGWLQTYDGVANGVVGTFEEPRATAMAALDNTLYVAAADPLGQPRCTLYGTAGTSATFSARASFSDGYPVSLHPLNKRLVMGWSRDGLVRAWDPSTLVLTELYAGAGPVGGLALVDGALYAGHRDASGGAPGLLRVDATTSSVSAATLATGAVVDEPLALALFGDQLWLGAGVAAGGAKVYRADPTAYRASGEVASAAFDGGLPELDKVWRAAWLRCALLPTGASLDLDARLSEGAGWTPLGSLSTAGAQEALFPFPAGWQGSQVWLRLRATRGAGAAASPEVREIGVRFVLVPAARRVWRFDVLLQGDPPRRPMRRLDGTTEPLGARSLAATLWGLRSQPGPLSFVDLEGAAHQVWLRGLEETVRAAPTGTPSATWSIARVTLVEA